MFHKTGPDRTVFVTMRRQLNHERAVRAMRALRGHEGKSQLHGYEVEESAIDTLTDIFHLLHEKGMNPDQIVQTALNHFDVERID